MKKEQFLGSILGNEYCLWLKSTRWGALCGNEQYTEVVEEECNKQE